MNEDRESAGSPVEETEATPSEVLAAVERAKEDRGEPGGETDVGENDGAAEIPEATSARSAASPEATSAASPITPSGEAPPPTQEDVPAEQFREAPRGSTVGLDTEPYIERPVIAEQQEMPSAAASRERGAEHIDVRPVDSETALPKEEPPVHDGEIRIDADHPMAALYMQTPMPPELKGNRGAGVLIGLLATVAFALVFAGAISLMLAPSTSPSAFVGALLERTLAWGFIAASVAFFVGLAVLVLIVGRAGWWAYVLGGFFVGLFVWAAGTAGAMLEARYLGEVVLGSESVGDLLRTFGLSFDALAAGIIAREVTVWFGAWIGSRGRRVTARNAEELAQYEIALAEARAKQP